MDTPFFSGLLDQIATKWYRQAIPFHRVNLHRP